MDSVSTTMLQQTHSDMVRKLAKSGQDILESLHHQDCHAIHMIMGVCGEAGELLDAIKKSVIYRKELDMENVIEELGDIEFYLEGLRQGLMITRESTLIANQNKLLVGENARYSEGGYSNEQAQNRADKQ
jgi:NTP pyrophosphatase (non-canonical NTP hydrolase)